MKYYRNNTSDPLYALPLRGEGPGPVSDLPYLPGQDHVTHMEMPLVEFVEGVQEYKSILEEAARPYILLTGLDERSQQEQEIAVVYPVGDDDMAALPAKPRRFAFSRDLSQSNALRFLFNVIRDGGDGDVLLFASQTAAQPFGVLRSYIFQDASEPK